MLMNNDDANEIVPSEHEWELAHRLVIGMAMEDANKIKIEYGDVLTFFPGLFAESDRAIGILAFAYIEAQLFDLFSQRLDPKVPGGIASIIGPRGILSGVVAQIRMLSALRWLRPATQHDLRMLARIRNRFAHAHSALTFGDAKIRGYLSSLTHHEEAFAKDFSNVVLLTRHQYLVRVVMTLFMMYSDLTLMPSSEKAGMGPMGAFSAGFDDYPTQLQNALGILIRVVRFIYEDATQGELKRGGFAASPTDF